MNDAISAKAEDRLNVSSESSEQMRSASQKTLLFSGADIKKGMR